MKNPRIVLACAIACAALAGCSGQNSAPTADVAAPAASTAGAAPVAASATTTATTTAAEAATLKVTRWGPSKARAGEPFNQQPDGRSSLWFELSGPIEQQKVTATLAGKPLAGVVVNKNVVTALVPDGYVTGKGEYPIEILIPDLAVTIQAGTLVAE